MKKTKFLTGLLLCFALFLCLPMLQAKASMVKSNDGVWQYKVKDGNNIQIQAIDNKKYAEVYGSISHVMFPSAIDGYKVTSVYLFQGALSAATESMTIPEGITKFDGSSFGLYPYETPRLTTISLPAEVTVIDNFEYFDNLTTINFAPNSQLQKIYAGAFEGMASLRSFNFEQFSKLDWIGYNAFKGTSLETVSIGDNVSIDFSAFSECPALTSVLIGKNCKLNQTVFENCTSLKSAVFGDGCSINYGAFNNDKQLSSLELGNVKELGKALFNTTKIKKLTIPKSCKKLPSRSNLLVPKSVVLYVDKGSAAEKYAKAAGYKYKYISASSTKVDKVTSLKAAKKSKSSIKVSWKKVNGASGYEVYMKTNSGSYKKAATIKKGSSVNCTVSKLKKNKTYTFKVRAYKNVGKKTVYGSYSSTKKLKLK